MSNIKSDLSISKHSTKPLTQKFKNSQSKQHNPFKIINLYPTTFIHNKKYKIDLIKISIPNKYPELIMINIQKNK